MDIKLQVYRGEAGPDKVDFRKSTGAFVGSPEDEHKTVLEVRVNDDDLPDGVTVEELEQGAAQANKFLGLFTEKVPDAFGHLLPGEGPIKIAIRVYDND